MHVCVCVWSVHKAVGWFFPTCVCVCWYCFPNKQHCVFFPLLSFYLRFFPNIICDQPLPRPPALLDFFVGGWWLFNQTALDLSDRLSECSLDKHVLPQSSHIFLRIFSKNRTNPSKNVTRILVDFPLIFLIQFPSLFGGSWAVNWKKGVAKDIFWWKVFYCCCWLQTVRDIDLRVFFFKDVSDELNATEN